MKFLRLAFSVFVMSISAVALGQSDGQKSFDELKLWQAPGKAR